MSPDTIEKISILSKQEFNQILDTVDRSQLLSDYEGMLHRPAQFWPPLPSRPTKPTEYLGPEPENPLDSVENPQVFQPSSKFSKLHPFNIEVPKVKQVPQSIPSQSEQQDRSLRGHPSQPFSEMKDQAQSIGLETGSLDVKFKRPQSDQILADIDANSRSASHRLNGPEKGYPEDPFQGKTHQQGSGHEKEYQEQLSSDTHRSESRQPAGQKVVNKTPITSDPLNLFPAEQQNLTSNVPTRKEDSAAFQTTKNTNSQGGMSMYHASPKKSWCARCCESCVLI